MNTIITSMDARTQPLTKTDIQEADADYLRFVLNNNPDARTRQLMEEELVRRTTRRPIVPVYPEPQGDPSY